MYQVVLQGVTFQEEKAKANILRFLFNENGTFTSRPEKNNGQRTLCDQSHFRKSPCWHGDLLVWHHVFLKPFAAVAWRKCVYLLNCVSLSPSKMS